MDVVLFIAQQQAVSVLICLHAAGCLYSMSFVVMAYWTGLPRQRSLREELGNRPRFPM